MAWFDRVLGAFGLARASQVKKKQRRKGFRKGEVEARFYDPSTTLQKLLEGWSKKSHSRAIFELVQASDKPISLKAIREELKLSPSQASDISKTLAEIGLIRPISGKPKKFVRVILASKKRV